MGTIKKYGEKHLIKSSKERNLRGEDGLYLNFLIYEYEYLISKPKISKIYGNYTLKICLLKYIISKHYLNYVMILITS